MNIRRSGIALLALCAALPASADTRFRVRQMTRNDVPLGKGQCDIRLQVDDEVEVAVRGDMVFVRTISGREARDDGSECNAPLPDRDLRGFNFEVKDSRNQIRLMDQPSRRNGFAAIVRIRDTDGGYGRYHFRLSWEMPSDAFGWRGDHDRPPDAGGFRWNNIMHFSGRGAGSSELSGFGAQQLFDASVDIDRGGNLVASFRTSTGRPLVFNGAVIGRDGDTLKADVSSDDRRLRLRGPMFLTLDRGEVYRISLEATNGRERLRLHWDRR